MQIALLAAVGYLLGAVPFGLIAGYLFGRTDVRQHGSGNTGMTNVMRTVGVKAAVLVLVLDMGKCVAAVLIARALTDSPAADAAATISAMVGHTWSVYLKFKGGKGTATGWGGLLVLSPISGLVATALGVAVVAGTRWVSLGSIVAATVGSAVLVGLCVTGNAPGPYAWFGIVGAPIIVFRHKDNIRRLMKGEERKLGQKTPGAAVQAEPRSRGVRWPGSV
ncbi:MAG: glycerol-3-phosphate 1-O-acyltransferase PlsY [SAR202 cluster bacterium]|nr:glycerol-3-phosphate 1-O-acyltransferase PlsY [SAR202 cluster bacterium]